MTDSNDKNTLLFDTFRGKEVVISGDFRVDLGMTKATLRDIVAGRGAAHVGEEDVRSTSSVFVKWTSPVYKYGEYGDKEAELARRAPAALHRYLGFVPFSLGGTHRRDGQALIGQRAPWPLDLGLNRRRHFFA